MLQVKDGIMSAIELRYIPECGAPGVVQPQFEELARRSAAERHQQEAWLQGTGVRIIILFVPNTQYHNRLDISLDT